MSDIVAKGIHAARHEPGGPDDLSLWYAQLPAFGAYLPVSLAPAPSGGFDDTALQAWLNTSTASAPMWLINPWTTVHKLNGTGLVFPFAPGTRLSGASFRSSQFVQHSENPVLRFTTGDTHSVSIDNIGFCYSTVPDATKTARNAVTYEGASGQSYYHHLYKNVLVQNAYRGWYVTGNATVWDTTWEQPRFEGVQHSCLDLTNVGQGCPRVTMRDVEITNTNTTVVSDGPAIITGGTAGEAEMVIDGLDIETWTGRILQAYGGYQTEVSHVHVEHHNMGTTETILFNYDGLNKQIHWLRNVTIESITFPTGGATEVDVAFLGTSGGTAGASASLRIDGIKVNTITNSAGLTKLNIARAGGTSATVKMGAVTDLTGSAVVKVPCDSSHSGALQKTDWDYRILGPVTSPPDGGAPVSGTQYMNNYCGPVMVVVSNAAGAGGVFVGGSGGGVITGVTSGAFMVPRGEGIKVNWTTTQPATAWFVL